MTKTLPAQSHMALYGARRGRCSRGPAARALHRPNDLHRLKLKLKLRSVLFYKYKAKWFITVRLGGATGYALRYNIPL